jgi:hypothetical protein
MTDYGNGKIYAIKSYINPNDVYYGSTCTELNIRLLQHMSKYTHYTKEKGHFRSAFHILKHGDAYIELVENFPCESKEELCKREGEYQKDNTCVNEQIAGRTKTEYYQDNKDAINAKGMTYYFQNKEAVLANQKQYYQDNKDAILDAERVKYSENKEFRAAKLAAAKKRVAEKPEFIASYQVDYYQKNKEALLQKQRDRKKTKGVEDDQKRRNKAAMKKGMNLDDMLPCPWCTCTFLTSRGVVRHKNSTCVHTLIRKAVYVALQRANIKVLTEIDGTYITVEFPACSGTIVLGNSVANVDHGPILVIPHSALDDADAMTIQFTTENSE